MKTRPIRHYVASSKRSAATARRMKEARAELLAAKALAGRDEQSHTEPVLSHVNSNTGEQS